MTHERKVKTISDRTWAGRQSWNREVIEQVGPHRFRYTVKIDAYDFQSYGRAELWKGEEGWTAVHKIPGQQLKAFGSVSYVSRSVQPLAFNTDLKELRKVAEAVVL